MKTYTVGELRNNTRNILNEALTEPIQITRYDETFVLTKAVGRQETKIVTPAEAVGGGIAKDAREVKAELDKKAELCPHGAAPGFCKVEKCPNHKK